MTQSTLAEIYNYRAADEMVGTSGQPSVAQLASIAKAGYQTVINLAWHDDTREASLDEADAVRSLGMTYVHVPVRFAAPTEADLLAFFAAMEAHGQEKLWVHCSANVRVSAFLGLYRAIRQGWELERAFELMGGLWQPNEVWSSFIATMLERHRG